MRPLKPGMLAMIVGLKKNTKLNGRCVKLIQPVEPGESFAIPIAPFEVRRYSKNNPSGWVCTGDIPKHLTSIVGGWGIFKPQNLYPGNISSDAEKISYSGYFINWDGRNCISTE